MKNVNSKRDLHFEKVTKCNIYNTNFPELSSECARLQIELNAARLEEFEAQEQLIESNTQLENERTSRMRAEEELAELKARNNALGRLASLEAEELVALREKFEQKKHAALELRKEADKVFFLFVI